MPRKARVIVPNCPHHIVQRGHNRNAVFVCDEDYQYYLENLIEAKRDYSISVYAYCRMTNHVHLIVDPGEEIASIGYLMKRLAALASERKVNIYNYVDNTCNASAIELME